MENRSKFNTQIYEEACEWFIDCRGGDLDDATRRDFDRWLRQSPEHLSAYLELAAIWNEGASLDPEGKFDRDTLIAQAAFDRDNVVALPGFRNITEASKRDLAPPTAYASRFRRRRLAAIAASTLFVLTVTAMLSWSTFRAPTYATAIGEQRSLPLPDGSTVELNSRSKIVVRYSKQDRHVELLEGQALFRVAKDADRPFIVRVGATSVRAVGTEFDVYQKRDGTVVTVVEGQVAILTDHPVTRSDHGVSATPVNAPRPHNLQFPAIDPRRIGNIVIAAGEQLTVTPKEIQMAEHPNIANATAWTQRQLIFESASLADVAEEFNRYNDRQLIIGDPALETFHVSGVFSSTDPASLIRFLRARPGLRIVETQSQIRIEKNT
ncbi:MAG: FecR family protein [Pseudomonadota bacterium]|nr:FecR family protein [Pseudomonadota bacterium]